VTNEQYGAWPGGAPAPGGAPTPGGAPSRRRLLASRKSKGLAAEAGRRARDAGHGLTLALWGLGLAVLDAAVWLVLHIAFDFGLLAG